MIVFIIIIAAILNFLYLSPPVVNWDEGTHGLWGYWVWLALREGNFGHFLALMRTQFAYPPIGSLTIALTNLPFAFSLQLARFASTIGFIVGGILMYLISKQLNPTDFFPESKHLKKYPRQSKETRTAGISSSILYFVDSMKKILTTKYFILLLYLTSPAILFYSVTVFKESWGLALTLFVIFLYFRALKIKSSASFFWVSLSLILLFLEKYNYAILLAVTLAMEAGVELSLLCFDALNMTRPFVVRVGYYVKFIKRQVAIFLPVLLFASWWILTPDNKLNWFMDIMRSDWNPVTVGVGSKIEYLLFYVNSIRASYVFSEVLFWFLLVGYFLAIKDLGNKKIRFLFVFFTLNMVLGTMHSINLQDRYIYTAVPALFLLGGYEIIWLICFLERQFLSFFFRRDERPLTISALVHCLSGSNSRSHDAFQKISQKPVFHKTFFVRCFMLIIVTFFALLIKDMLYFSTLLKSNVSHMLLTAMYNETDYKDTLFDFDRSHWPKLADGNWLLAVGNNKKRQTPEDVFDYLLQNIDVNKPVEIVGHTSELSPDWFRLRVELYKLKVESEKSKAQLTVYDPAPQESNYSQLVPSESEGSKSEVQKINNYLVTIEVRPDSRLYTYDYRRANLWQLDKIREIEKQYQDSLLKEKNFADLGVGVRIYGL